jgi:hypothetical protein
MLDAKSLRQLIGQLALKGRVRCAVSGHGERSITKLLARDVREIRAVDAARKRDDN